MSASLAYSGELSMNILSYLIDRNWYMPLVKPKDSLLPYYEYIADQLGMPIELVIAHAQLESQQYYLARGKAGEYGLWQFLPSTWKGLMGSANWQSIDNQCAAYIQHTRNIINRYGLNLHNTAHVTVYLWVWNAGGGNYEKDFMPVSTREYIRVIKQYQAQVEV